MDVKDAGKRGGLRTLERMGVDHFKRISKIAVEVRKTKKNRHENPLDNTPTA